MVTTMTSTQEAVGALQVGDVAVFVDGDVPFVVVAVGPEVGGVRQLDLTPARGGRSRARVTMAVSRAVQLIGREAAVAATG